MELEKIDPKDVADLCQKLFLYARQRDFRPEPVGDVLWLITKLLGLGRYDCRLKFAQDWRKKMLKHGLDPVSGERFDEGAFQTALQELIAHRHQIKEARKAKREGQESSSESNGESSPEGEVLTPLAMGQLRAIKAKLDARRAPGVSRYTNSPCRGFSEGGEPGGWKS
jgi:hypothetical protein